MRIQNLWQALTTTQNSNTPLAKTEQAKTQNQHHDAFDAQPNHPLPPDVPESSKFSPQSVLQNPQNTSVTDPPSYERFAELLSSAQFMTWVNIYVKYAESQDPELKPKLLSLGQNMDWDAQLMRALFKTDDWNQIIEAPLAFFDVLEGLCHEIYSLVTNPQESGLVQLVGDSWERSKHALEVMNVPDGLAKILVYPLTFGTFEAQLVQGLWTMGKSMWTGKNPAGEQMTLRERMVTSLNLFTTVYGPKAVGKAANQLKNVLPESQAPAWAPAYVLNADGSIALNANQSLGRTLTQALGSSGLRTNIATMGVLATNGPVQLFRPAVNDPIATPFQFAQSVRTNSPNTTGAIPSRASFSKRQTVNGGQQTVDDLICNQLDNIPTGQRPHHAKHAASEHVNAAQKAVEAQNRQFSYFKNDGVQRTSINAALNALRSHLNGQKPKCPPGVKKIEVETNTRGQHEVLIEYRDTPTGTVYDANRLRQGTGWRLSDAETTSSVYYRQTNQCMVIFNETISRGQSTWYPATSFPVVR